MMLRIDIHRWFAMVDFCIWWPFCTLVTMATAAILNCFNPPKAATHYGGYSYKFDERNPIFSQWVISLNLVLAELRLGLKNRQVGEK
jgi:hypothetical protein